MLIDHIVLAGGGHTHALVLLRWAMNPKLKPSGLITLVNKGSTTIYSGMLPGLVANKYKFDDILIDLRTLAFKADVAFVRGEIEGININQKKLILLGRPDIEYSALSLDIGTQTKTIAKSPFKNNNDLAIPIKPFGNSFQLIVSQDIYKDDMSAEPFSIIGSGLAAIEISFALRKRWPKRSIHLHVKSGKKISNNLIRCLKDFNVEIKQNNDCISYPALICTGNQEFEWIKNSGLPLDKYGRIKTHRTLQVINHPELFAVGDCGVIQENYRPPSGVWAVRSAIPLAKNLENMNNNLRLKNWRPQKYAMQILDTYSGEKHSKGFISWAKITIGPYSFISKLKEIIDIKFINKFNIYQDIFPKKMKEVSMKRCRGCASKLAYLPLNSVLQRLSFIDASTPEDSSNIALLRSGKSLIQSIDGFPALISDPWLNGRLLALHACSDIWACGGSVLSAQASVALPSFSNDLQKELLFQVLEGIQSALSIQGAQLIGGHTLESQKTPEEPISLSIETSLAVNGIVDKGRFWNKAGLKKGDDILISRSLGSGVMFSAFMNGKVNPFEIDYILKEMNKSQHKLIEYINQIQEENPSSTVINSCTDITGFGLLGHLLEMLEPTNIYRLNINLEPIKIILDLDKLPVYNGVIRLIKEGHQSTLAPSNEIFLRKINSDRKTEIEMNCNSKVSVADYNAMLKILIDPQTCGPLVVSCSSFYADKLIKNGPWQRIGFVS